MPGPLSTLTLLRASGALASDVEIGIDIQAYSSVLAAIAAGTWAGAGSITTLGTITTGVWSGTSILSSKLASDVVLDGEANTFTAGMKQSVSHNSTNAGFRVIKASGDPSSLVDGDVWYESGSEVFKTRVGSRTLGLLRHDPFLWGHGGDGNITLDGIATVTIGGVAHAPSGGMYTLTVPLNAKTLTINNTIGLASGGCPIRCWELTGAGGVIRDKGANATGGNQGSGLTAAGISRRTSGSGAAGVMSAQPGVNGSSVTSALGAAGGAGAAGGVSIGGTAGGVTAPTITVGDPAYTTAVWLSSKGLDGTPFSGGAGGGSGGFDVGAVGTSGAGGAGGGVLCVFARAVSGSLELNVRGGNGGNASGSSGIIGGGGGGGGGRILFVYEEGTVPTLSVIGGTGGTGINGGASGNSGSNGSSTSIRLL